MKSLNILDNGKSFHVPEWAKLIVWNVYTTKIKVSIKFSMPYFTGLEKIIQEFV